MSVKTVSGKTIEREKTKLIKGEYYEEGVDCFKLEGKWYRINSGLISLNLDKGVFFLNKDIDKGGFSTKLIVGKDYAGENIIGYTTLPREFFVTIKTKDGDVFVANEAIAGKFGNFNKEIGMFSSDKGKQNISYINPQDLHYSLKDYQLPKKITCDSLVEKYDYRTFFAGLGQIYHDLNMDNANSKLKEQYNQVLGGTTFGIESEANNANLASLELVARNGVVCLRDGSIKGFELATHPHKGYSGLIMTINQFARLSQMFHFDKACSVHIHVAGKKLSDEQMFGLYCLCVRIQDEIFEYVHPYKRNIEYLKGLQHEYSEPLKSLGIVYNKGIVGTGDVINKTKFATHFKEFCKFITHGASDKVEDVYKGVPKYRINARYFWINFVNLFENREATVEFRCFPPSFHGHTIALWSFICKAIYHYGTTNYVNILKDGFHVKMQDVFNYLLDGLEEESNKEFFKLVKDVDSEFYNTIAAYSNNYIGKNVQYNHYHSEYADYCNRNAKALQALDKDVQAFTWKDPDVIAKIASYFKK